MKFLVHYKGYKEEVGKSAETITFEDSCILDTSGFDYANVVNEEVIEKWKHDIIDIEENKYNYHFIVYDCFIITFTKLGAY